MNSLLQTLYMTPEVGLFVGRGLKVVLLQSVRGFHVVLCAAGR